MLTIAVEYMSPAPMMTRGAATVPRFVMLPDALDDDDDAPPFACTKTLPLRVPTYTSEPETIIASPFALVIVPLLVTFAPIKAIWFCAARTPSLRTSPFKSVKWMRPAVKSAVLTLPAPAYNPPTLITEPFWKKTP